MYEDEKEVEERDELGASALHSSIYIGYRRASVRTTTCVVVVVRSRRRNQSIRTRIVDSKRIESGNAPRALAAYASWAARSSMMESLIPLPLGKRINGLLPVPMTKTLVARVANS